MLILILLIIFALATRLPHLFNNIPFGFDHGRDALAVLHLIKTHSLKFIGPWTSIPGLFFGPGWYYLLAPAFFILNNSPLAAPITMQFLGLIQIWLAYKYFGIYEAIIFSSAPIFFITTTSAANPFPMILIGLLLLIALEKKWPVFWQGIILSLGFHFSSALAIFWLIVIFFLRKPKSWPKLILGIFLPFIPQALFELKNNFIETRSLINYFIQGETQHLTPGKISLVTNSVLHELNLAIMPDYAWLTIPGIILLIYGLWLKPKIGLLIITPLIGFWFLHYNPWYTYGLMPLAVIAAGTALRRLPRPLVYTYLGLLIFSAIKLPREQNKAVFLKTKMQAINYIYQQASNKPFNSYHYLPNIYDYSYQYLYFWQGFAGLPLPTEFTYQPGEISYVTEKPDLLKKFPLSSPALKTFLIIEKPENEWHYPLSNWLNRIQYTEIVSKKEFGPELEVWEVILKN